MQKVQKVQKVQKIRNIQKIQEKQNNPKASKIEDKRTSTLTHLSALCACSHGKPTKPDLESPMNFCSVWTVLLSRVVDTKQY